MDIAKIKDYLMKILDSLEAANPEEEPPRDAEEEIPADVAADTTGMDLGMEKSTDEFE